LRSQLPQALQAIAQSMPKPRRIVLTSPDGLIARFAATDGIDAPCELRVLEGGTAAWAAQGRPLASGEERLASPAIDRYRRPYEGTQNAREAMQAYLDWEFGLVAQLGRDGTHRFRVLRAGT
jgi:hypothetical protein